MQRASESGTPTPILTMGVITISLLVFFAVQVQAGKVGLDAAQTQWGYVPASKIWDGEYRGLVSAVFVHGDYLHLLFNMLWLWSLGSAVELEIGPARWLAFFLGATVVSSGAQLYEGGTGIGMSGFVYALAGFAWVSRWQIDRFRAVLSPQSFMFLMIWLVGCWVATIGGWMHIGNEAHLGGLLFGAAVGAVFVRRKHLPLMIAALILLVAVSMVPVFGAPWTGEWAAHKAMQAHDRQDLPTAIRWYRVALARGEDPVWGWHNLAGIYNYQGDGPRYLEAIENLRKADPQDAAGLEKELGTVIIDPPSRSKP